MCVCVFVCVCLCVCVCVLLSPDDRTSMKMIDLCLYFKYIFG